MTDFVRFSFSEKWGLYLFILPSKKFLTCASDLMQEQPTLEMVSAGSDTQETSSLNRSFNMRLIRDS